MTAKEMTTTDMALQGKALEEFVVRGNLAALSPTDKAAHYIQLCQSLGLNPATKPFEYLNLQGKEVLYARRDATEQLRKIHNVSLEITNRETVNDIYVVTARAQLPDGRRDESTGAVSIAGLKGDMLANKLMSCETKAKRRVTLSIVGLGLLDESELDTIQGDRFGNLTREPAREPAKLIEIERSETRKGEALEPIPGVIGAIPPSIMLAHHDRLNGLAGIKLADLDTDDLELVIDVMRKAYAVRQPSGKASKLELDWYKAIAEQAKSIVAKTEGPPPPEFDGFHGGEM